MKTNNRTEEFTEKLYKEIATKKVYITNLTKCTQADTRPLKDNVFKEYLKYTKEGIVVLRMKHIITFGNQVSSILLGKNIKVSEYKKRGARNTNHQRENIQSISDFLSRRPRDEKYASSDSKD